MSLLWSSSSSALRSITGNLPARSSLISQGDLSYEERKDLGAGCNNQAAALLSCSWKRIGGHRGSSFSISMRAIRCTGIRKADRAEQVAKKSVDLGYPSHEYGGSHAHASTSWRGIPCGRVASHRHSRLDGNGRRLRRLVSAHKVSVHCKAPPVD
jgi:hypothetical protein